MGLVGRSRRSTSSLLVLRRVARRVEVRRGHVSRDIQIVSGYMRIISSWTHSKDLPGRRLKFDLFIRDKHCCISLSGTSTAR